MCCDQTPQVSVRSLSSFDLKLLIGHENGAIKCLIQRKMTLQHLLNFSRFFAEIIVSYTIIHVTNLLHMILHIHWQQKNIHTYRTITSK